MRTLEESPEIQEKKVKPVKAIMKIRLKRIYEKPSAKDGYRVLVDRLWPRGIAKDAAKLDAWQKEIAPSDELRKWFGHHPEKWEGFKKRYFAELKKRPEAVEELVSIIKKRPVTFVYAAKDEDFNNAAALKEYIEKHIK